MNVTPQVFDKSPSIDALRWQQVSGVFKAKGAEEYLTIGSFYKEPVFLGFYYVFIDDVSLTPIKLDLGADTTLCGRNDTYRLDATTPGAISYLWSDGSTQSSLLVTKPGRYAVTVITPCVTLKTQLQLIIN